MPASKIKEENYFLPGDYYRKVNPFLAVIVVSVFWFLLPCMAFFPNALDLIWNDRLGDFIERNHFNLIKAFNVILWLHMIECIVAIKKCRQHGINSATTLYWIGNVAIFGILALRFLLWPDKDVKRIKVH